MRCEIMSRNGDKVTFQMVFEPEAFERKIIEAYRVFRAEDVRRPEFALLSTSALLERCDSAVEIVREAIQSLLRENCEDAMSRLNLVAMSDLDVQPVSGELDEPLTLVVSAVVAPSADSLKYQSLVASYNEVVIDGSEVDAKLAHARTRYGVATNEELLEKIQAYDSVDEMRVAVEGSLRRFVGQMNVAAKREAAAKALIDANPMEVSESEIEQYVDDEIQKLRDQMGEDSFKSQGYDMPTLRAIVRRDVGHMPHLNRILASLSTIMGIKITEKDRLEEIEAARAQSVRPDSMEPVEDTMRALRSNPAMLNALDRKIAMDKALDYVVSETVFKVRAGLTLRESAPQYLTQL